MRAELKFENSGHLYFFKEEGDGILTLLDLKESLKEVGYQMIEPKEWVPKIKRLKIVVVDVLDEDRNILPYTNIFASYHDPLKPLNKAKRSFSWLFGATNRTPLLKNSYNDILTAYKFRGRYFIKDCLGHKIRNIKPETDLEKEIEMFLDHYAPNLDSVIKCYPNREVLF